MTECLQIVAFTDQLSQFTRANKLKINLKKLKSEDFSAHDFRSENFF